jgi:predicted RNA binding protein YcfA (HicA-like mRNA interferase family)
VAPGISRRELISKFKSLGFDGPYSGGKHQFMQKANLKVRIPNPHRGDISIGLVRELLKQAGIEIREWDEA